MYPSPISSKPKNTTKFLIRWNTFFHHTSVLAGRLQQVSMPFPGLWVTNLLLCLKEIKNVQRGLMVEPLLQLIFIKRITIICWHPYLHNSDHIVYLWWDDFWIKHPHPNKMVNNNTWSDRKDPLDGTNLCINLSPLLLLPLSIDNPLYGRNNRRHAFKVDLAASKEKARTICESKLPQKSMELRMMKRVIQLRYLCSDHHFVYWVLKPRLNEKN